MVFKMYGPHSIGNCQCLLSVSVFSFQYFIESKAYKNITIHIYIDEISSFQVYTSQRVWAEASLSKSPYQSIVAINLVFCSSCTSKIQ